MAARWQFGLGRDNGLLFWAMIATEAAFGCYFALWPLWIERLGAAVGVVGLMLGLGGIIRLIALLPSAWLARRFGLKHVAASARFVMTVALVFAASAPHWPWLLPALVGMGIGDMVFPLASTFAALHAGEHRVRAFTIIFTTGPSVSLLVMPLLSGAMVHLWGLRAPFLAAAIFAAISGLLFTRVSPTPLDEEHEDQAHRGYLGLLRVPGLRLLLILQFLTFFALGIGTSLLSIYLHDAHGFSEAVISPLSSATAVGSLAFAATVARSAPLTRRPLLAVAVACGFAIVGYGLFLKADLLVIALIAMMLRGGFFAAWPLYSAVLGEATPAHLRANVFAMGEILAGTGFVVAPTVAGLLYDRNADLPLIVSAVMLIPLVGLLGWLGTVGIRPSAIGNRS